MSSQSEQSFYEFGPFRVDTLKRLLLREGQPVPLTAKAFDTLVTFVRHSGQDLDKDELMRTVWPDTIVEENNLTQNVSMLRKALGENKSEHRYIVTIPGRGYRFVASVTEVFSEGNGALNGRAGTQETLRRVEKAAPSLSPGSDIAASSGEGKTDAADEGNTDAADVRSANAATLLPAVAAAAPRARVPASLLRAAVVVVVLLVGVALIYWWLTRAASPSPERIAPPGSIAVLPFKTLGMASSDDYLGLGMADALITKLSNIRQISVRPTSAVIKYAGSNLADPVAAGRELNVDSVVEGSIQRAGDRVRVTVQLVSVRESRPLWAYTFDERLTDIFSVQDSISAQVAQALTLKLTGEEERLLAKRYTLNVEAYQSYLRGRFFWNKRNEESLNLSIVYFNEAIARDPSYALAYAGLADAHSVIGFYQFGKLSPAESYLKAKAASLKAIELDETLAEAHVSLALAIGDVDADDAAAEREYKRAIELNPSYATAHHWYSDFLATAGRPLEAMAEVRRALELDPLSLVINATLGERLYQARRYDEAIAQLRKTLEMDSGFGPAHYLLGLALEQKGLYEEAIAALNQARRISGSNPWMVSALGHTLALSGKKSEAQKILGELKELSRARHVSAYDFAVVHQGLGQKEQAFDWLQKLRGDKARRSLIADPRMDDLRDDARLRQLSQS